MTKLEFFTTNIAKFNKKMLCLLITCILAATSAPALAVKTYTDNEDGTVTDVQTGMTWMRCVMGETLVNSACTGNRINYSFDEASALTGSITFAGKSDWRLPTLRELLSIVDRDSYPPSLNLTAFPESYFGSSWTSSSNSFNTSFKWYIDTNTGVSNNDLATAKVPVRLVRGTPSSDHYSNLKRPNSDYVDAGGGTVTHSPSGLMWQRCTFGQRWSSGTCEGVPKYYSYDSALTLTDTLAGYSDWRLPSDQELVSLVDFTEYSPTINKEVFSSTQTKEFWTTAKSGSTGWAWTVDFSNGQNTSQYRADGAYVRLVRKVLPTDLLAQTISTVSLNPNGLSVGTTTTAIATATSGLSVTFSSITPLTCSVSGSTVTGVAVGTCTVAANQVGNGTYAPSPHVTQNITVEPAAPVNRPELINIATRGKVETGDNVMIAGFIVQGDAPKTVLITARGPSMAGSSV